jgi:acyl-coenzyme A thioesterase PaaI-like protein
MCLVCGLRNPHGLKAFFYELESGDLVATFTPGDEHQSYPGRLHGGIATAVLDEAIGRAIRIRYGDDLWGVTVEVTTRFKKPIPLGQLLTVRCRITHEDTRFFEGTGEIFLADGEVAATGKGKYIKLPLGKISDFNAEEQEWKITESPDDPTEFAP